MIGNIDGTCPQCGSRLKFTLDDVARQRTVRCARGHGVDLKDNGGGARKARQAEQKFERSLRDLERKMKRLGKR